MNVYLLLILAVACITWTVTKEEIFRPFRMWLGWQQEKAQERGRAWGVFQEARQAARRRLRWRFVERLAYMPTCDYCLGHWVMLVAFLIVSPPPLVAAGVVGHVLTYFVLVAGTAATTTLFSVVRQFNKLLTEVAKWHEQQNQPHYAVSSGYDRQKAA